MGLKQDIRALRRLVPPKPKVAYRLQDGELWLCGYCLDGDGQRDTPFERMTRKWLADSPEPELLMLEMDMRKEGIIGNWPDRTIHKHTTDALWWLGVRHVMQFGTPSMSCLAAKIYRAQRKVPPFQIDDLDDKVRELANYVMDFIPRWNETALARRAGAF